MIDCCVAASGALLGIPVGLAHGVVEVDEHQLVGVGQDRGRGREPGQQPGGHVPAEQSEMFAVYRYDAVFTDNTPSRCCPPKPPIATMPSSSRSSPS